MVKKIGLIVLVVLAIGLVLRDFIIKQVIVSVGSSIVGAPVKVGGFSMSLITHQIHMKDVKLYNPEGFTDNSLIDIARIDVHYHPLALIGGKLHFSLIDLDVRQLAVEHNKEGKYNVASLKIAPKESAKVSNTPSTTGTAPLDLNIEVLKLNVDQVIYRDDANGKVKQSTVGLHQKTFKNITSPQQLAALVLFEASGLGSLKNLALSATKDVIGDITNLTDGAGETVHSLLGSVKSLINK